MSLEDEWVSPHAMLDAFIEEMRKSPRRKGNPPQTIDYKYQPIGEKVTIVNNNKKKI